MLKWIKFICCLVVAGISVLPCYSQQMEITNFKKSKHIWPFKKKYPTNKKYALLDFHTSDKEFVFWANGNIPVEMQENKGYLTLILPHKTNFVVISHDKFGQYTWKVPGKPLKKKKHYYASLMTYDKEEAYQLAKQWVSFKISPSNAWLYVDSTRIVAQTDRVELFLPLGKHHYRTESPFHEAVEDTFLLTDTGTLEIPVIMRPTYSYLTVNTPFKDAEIWIDGYYVGKEKGTSQRLMEGIHELTVVLNNVICYKDMIYVAGSEKKRLCIKKEDFSPLSLTKKETESINSFSSSRTQTDSIFASVCIYAQEKNEEILIDREMKATGEWKGYLPLGKYAIQTKKEGMESRIVWLHVNDSHPKELWLPTYHTAYGLLSIQCNVPDTEVWIDGKMMGKTPVVLSSLPAGKPLGLELKKKGYKTLYKQIVLTRNNLLEMNLILNK